MWIAQVSLTGSFNFLIHYLCKSLHSSLYHEQHRPFTQWDTRNVAWVDRIKDKTKTYMSRKHLSSEKSWQFCLKPSGRREIWLPPHCHPLQIPVPDSVLSCLHGFAAGIWSSALQSSQHFLPKPHKCALQPYAYTPSQRREQKAHRQTKPTHWKVFMTDFFLNLKAQWM